MNDRMRHYRKAIQRVCCLTLALFACTFFGCKGFGARDEGFRDNGLSATAHQARPQKQEKDTSASRDWRMSDRANQISRDLQ